MTKNRKPRHTSRFEKQLLIEHTLRSHCISYFSLGELNSLRQTSKSLLGLVAEFSADLAFQIEVVGNSRAISAIASALPFVPSIRLDALPDTSYGSSPTPPAVLQSQIESVLYRLSVLSSLSSLEIIGAYDPASLLHLLTPFPRLRCLFVESFGLVHTRLPHTVPVLGALEELEVVFYGGENAMDAVLRSMPRLRTLVVRPADCELSDCSCSLSHKVAESLVHVPLLKSLTLHCFLSDAHVEALAAALPNTPILEDIDLRAVFRMERGSCFGPLGVAAIARALPRLPRLRALTLQGSGAGDAGAESLANAFHATPLLECFSLKLEPCRDKRHPIGDVGVQALARSLLRHSRCLTELNLAGHSCGAGACASILELLLQRCRLRSLNLTAGRFGTAFTDAFIASLLPQGATSLHHLERLFLSVGGPARQPALECFRALVACVPVALPALNYLGLLTHGLRESDYCTGRLESIFPPTLSSVGIWEAEEVAEAEAAEDSDSDYR